MPSAKTDFIQRIRSLRTTIEADAVTNRALSDTAHNSMAKLLRNGLAVVGFATLEDFIKKRSSEAMSEVGNISLPFSSLPEKLRKAATYEALSALNYQLTLLDNEDKITYIQRQATKIASTATASYELSDHTFGYAQANVSDKVIGNILKSFNVDDPWRQMSAIASDTGLTGLPLIESYRNAARRRHKAAHVASSDIPQNDILQFVNESFAIAIGFDALLSKSLQKYRENNTSHIDCTTKVQAQDLTLRVVKYSESFWKEYVDGSLRAYRRSTDIEAFRGQVKARAAAQKNLYLEFDNLGLVSFWECY